MFSIADFEPWWRFGLALLIGALIGLEREFFQQKRESPNFAGIRTFALIALMGAVAAFLVEDFGNITVILTLSGLILLISVSYLGTIYIKKMVTGITTEITAILSFLFGVLVMSDHAMFAIVLAVSVTILLAFKGTLHGFIRNMSTEDIFVTLKFALVAAVILPLLPNRPIDPWGLFNPFQVWLMVVLVSGIGFSGYVFMKILGTSKGIYLSGIFGGLASSTATTISFSTASRQYPEMAIHYARAVILASTVMFPRIFVLVLLIHPPLAIKIAIPLLVMLISGLVYIFFFQKKSFDEEEAVHPEFTITNPLKLSTAIKFGLLYAVVSIVVDVAQRFLGSSGVYLVSFVAGITDVNAITLSISRLVSTIQLSLNVAAIAVIIAALVNTLAKGVISFVSGSPELRKTVIRAFLIMLVSGVLSSVIVFFL
jgi:uncharacterized membrane protein (DUF4010 family)